MGPRIHLKLGFTALLLIGNSLRSQDVAKSATLDSPLKSLREVASRTGSDFRPGLLGETVTVRGVATSAPLEAPDAVYLSIADPVLHDNGLMLIFSGDNKDKQPAAGLVKAGALIEAHGIVSLHAGQAVLKPLDLKVTGKTDPPKATSLLPKDAASFRYLGMLVTIEGVVSESHEAPTGELIELAETGQDLRIFLPVAKRTNDRLLSSFQPGDRVRIRGLVSQFCPSPPYNRFFQVLLSSARDISLLEQRPMLPPQIVPAAVLVILLAILSTWYLQQRSSRQNRIVQQILQGSEELYSASSAREVADVLRNRLLEFIPGESAAVYHYDPSRKVAERVPDQTTTQPHSFNIDECSTLSERAIALAVRNKALLQFADTQRADILQSPAAGSQSILVLPMRKRDELRGVIVIVGKGGQVLLSEALQPAAQHLANDACQFLESLEQASMREQIHRSEKLAVAGQLIHGVITELKIPLENLRLLATQLPASEAALVQAQVQKASETVRRIISVARAEQIDARPIELRAMFQKLALELQTGLEASEVECEVNLPPDPIHVIGSQEQLGQVFAQLLQHASFAAQHSLEHLLTIDLSRIGRSAMVEIGFSGPFGEGEGPDFSGAALGMAISRGLIQSHGGDVRFSTQRAGRFRYEVELPTLSANPADDFNDDLDPAQLRGQITALLVEPETQSQRRLLAIFGELNHRLISVSNIEEAADLTEKVRFDIIFSSARPEGGTWAELFHRVHHRTPHFALMSESAEIQNPDSQDASLLDGASASVLPKPIEQSDILNLLSRLQQPSITLR